MCQETQQLPYRSSTQLRPCQCKLWCRSKKTGKLTIMRVDILGEGHRNLLVGRHRSCRCPCACPVLLLLHNSPAKENQRRPRRRRTRPSKGAKDLLLFECSHDSRCSAHMHKRGRSARCIPTTCADRQETARETTTAVARGQLTAGVRRLLLLVLSPSLVGKSSDRYIQSVVFL